MQVFLIVLLILILCCGAGYGRGPWFLYGPVSLAALLIILELLGFIPATR